MSFSDAARCTAKAKSTGERCHNPAVTGYSVCRMHGAGNRKTPGGRPVVHGRYSKNVPERLAQRYEEAQQDADLLELRAEIALVTARLSELLASLDTETGGQHWQQLKQTWQKLKKAKATKDYLGEQSAMYDMIQLIEKGASEAATWQEIYNVIDQRRRLAESEWKRLVQLRQVITAERAMVLIAMIVDTVRSNVKDEQALRAIAADIRRISVIDTGG